VFSKRFWAVFVNLADILLLIEVKLTAFFLQKANKRFSRFSSCTEPTLKKYQTCLKGFFIQKQSAPPSILRILPGQDQL